MSEYENEIHKDFTTGDVEVKDVIIKLERDSISLADDITAPHHKNIFVNKNTMLSDLIEHNITEYIVKIKNTKWEIYNNNKLIGYIVVNQDGGTSCNLFIPDVTVEKYNNQLLFCKRKDHDDKILGI